MIEVPLEIELDPDDPAQALPYVAVEVRGRKVRALLDTGAGRTALTAPADAEITVHRSEGTGVFGVGGDRLAWNTSIRFGDQVIGPIEIDSHAHGTGCDLIGQDVLSQFRCEYRFADRQLKLDGPLPLTAVPIFLGEGRHVYLDIEWPGNETASAVFDTGASVTVVDSAFVDTHHTLFSPAGTSQGIDASGTIVDTPMVCTKLTGSSTT